MRENPVNCPRCTGRKLTRSGIISGKQRYRCARCNYHFTGSKRGMPAEIKRLAIHLYLEGLGYRAISRILGVSDVAVAKWINPLKESLLPLRKRYSGMQELHRIETFLITKEAFNRFGWLFIGMEDNAGLCMLSSYTMGSFKLY